MGDSLAVINVDQLSSAVNSVVRASAIGQLPLDPSPPPAEDEGGREKAENVVPSAAVSVVRAPCSSAPSVQIPPPHQAQSISSPGQSQTASGQLYTIRQIGNNLVLVPTSTANGPPQQPASLLHPVSMSNSSLLQPGVRSNETLYQPSGARVVQSTAPNTAPAVYTQSVTPTSLVTQHAPHINMNIAIHIPSPHPPLQIPAASQVSGCGLQPSVQPIRSHQVQDSAPIHPQVVNLVTPPSEAQPLQVGTSNTSQLVIVPNKTTPVQPNTQPLTSQPQVTSVSLPVTIVTPPTRGNTSEVVQLAPSVSVSSALASSMWGNHASNVSLISPTLNVTSQGQSSLSPLTSLATLKALQSGCQDNQIVTLNEALQLQQSLLKANHMRGVNATENQSLHLQQTLLKASHTKAAKATDNQSSYSSSSSSSSSSKPARVHRERSKAMASSTEKYTSSKISGNNRWHRHRHRSPSSVILDKPIMSRARQSLPDILTLKPSLVNPGEIGVYAKQEIAASTRFGPLIGHLSEVNPSQEYVKAHPKAWKICSEGKIHQLLHTTDESQSNWMMFVQLARQRGQHNISSFQAGQEIFFTSIELILPGQELVIWSSKEHGTKTRVERAFKCRQCGAKFSSKAALTEHSEHDHSPPTHGTKRFRCTFCPRSYPTATKLKAHLLAHKGVKPHRCEVCGKGFTDRSNMKQHMLIHSGVKQYMCDVCGRSFRQKTHLKAHQVTHTGKKDLECPICHKMFGRINDLSFHIKQHREGKKFHCRECDASFWKESQLARHTKIHTGERDYQCHLCGKGFITGYHLNRHLKSCERDEQFLRKPWPGCSKSSNRTSSSSIGRSANNEGRTLSQTCVSQELASPMNSETSTLSQAVWPEITKSSIAKPSGSDTSASSQVPWSECSGTRSGGNSRNIEMSTLSQTTGTLVVSEEQERDGETREQHGTQSESHRKETDRVSREENSKAPRVLRSSRGRPIRPKIFPMDVTEPDEDQPLRKRARRRTRPQVAFCTSDGPVGNEDAASASPVAITMYEAPCRIEGPEMQGSTQDQITLSEASLHSHQGMIKNTPSVGRDSPTDTYHVPSDRLQRVNPGVNMYPDTLNSSETSNAGHYQDTNTDTYQDLDNSTYQDPVTNTYHTTSDDSQIRNTGANMYLVPSDRSQEESPGTSTYSEPSDSSREEHSDPCHQQSTTTLSQLAITVPQESPGVLECDDFASAASLARSQLESGFDYNAEDTSENDGIPDAGLTSSLFDLSDGTSMSSTSQSMSTYNAQSFDLSNEDAHSDAFDAGSQVHGSTSQAMFMSDPSMVDSVATSSNQACLRSDHQNQGTPMTEGGHSQDFDVQTQVHSATSQSLFTSDSSMVESIPTSANPVRVEESRSHDTSLIEDTHSGAFTETQIHVRNASSQVMFMSEPSVVDSVNHAGRTSSIQVTIQEPQTSSTVLTQAAHLDAFSETNIHNDSVSQELFAADHSTVNSEGTLSRPACLENPSTSLAGNGHSEAFDSESQVHGATSQTLFMTGPSIMNSPPNSTNQVCLENNQNPSTSLASDTLFSMVPSEESSASLPQHATDEMDITVDLHAIEGALDSDDDEQCSDERRGDTPSDNIEE